MANTVLNWVWDHSQAKHAARLVMLAIADRAHEDGSAWMSVADIQKRTLLGARIIQGAVIALAKAGELEVKYQEGPRGCNRYRILMTPANFAPPQTLRGAESAPPQDLRPTESSQDNPPDPAKFAPPAESAPPQNPAETPAKSAGKPHKEPKNSPSESSIQGGAGGESGSLFGEDEPPARDKRGKAPKKQPVATRIPDDFAVDDDMRSWAERSIPGYDYMAETENFIDWWQAKAGAGALKTSWPATWRTWMRRNAKEAAPSVNGHNRRRGSRPTNYTDEEYASGW